MKQIDNKYKKILLQYLNDNSVFINDNCIYIEEKFLINAAYTFSLTNTTIEEIFNDYYFFVFNNPPIINNVFQAKLYNCMLRKNHKIKCNNSIQFEIFTDEPYYVYLFNTREPYDDRFCKYFEYFINNYSF